MSSSNERLTSPPPISEPPRDALDRAYLEATWPAGNKPALARKRQFSEVMNIPAVAFGQLDRGHRVGDSPLLKQVGEPPDPVENVQEVLYDDLEYEKRRRVIWDRIALFIADSKDALQAGHRFAAVMMRTGDIGPAEMVRTWPDLTKTPLTNARKQLDSLLAQVDEGGAK